MNTTTTDGPSARDDALTATGIEPGPETDQETEGRAAAWGRRLSYRNISVLYLLAALLVLFSVTTSQTFWATGTFSSIFAQQATIAVLALGLIVPLAAGGFDLSIGYTATFSSTLTASLVVNEGWPTWRAIALTFVCCLVIGAINGLIVVRFRINSFIATLATGAVISALIVWVSGARDISGLPAGFTEFAVGGVGGLVYPALVALVIAVVLWAVLEHTPAGRYLFATGGGPEAAKLSGIRTERVVALSFVVSAGAAGIAGALDLARLGVASTSLGGSYLLPAFAAAFLGATQFKQGRPNVWGTVIALLVLATGAKGFDLMGLDYWLKDIFYGVALLVAVGLAASQGTSRQTTRTRARRTRPRIINN